MPELPESTPPKPAEAAAPATALPKGGAPAAAAPAPKPAPVAWECAMTAELKQQHGEAIVEASSFLGQNYIVVERSEAATVLGELHGKYGFNILTDITAVHYPKDALPFEVVWFLYSMKSNERVRLKTRVTENDEVQSATSIWAAANWLEREVYDMFGLRFAGHPDLRRILLPEEWTGHPLRKDYGVRQQDSAWVKKNIGIESGQ